jgi:signal transduction histidine kinase
MSEDGSTPGDPVYICIAESQLNAVLSNLESAKVILDNLVANAAKYTNLGQINVDCRSEGGCLLVSVEDTGP